jgi:2-polyprenyl-3-methyl-5-hydroxy-6-metoxy-1,4-benzoquinol methylase
MIKTQILALSNSLNVNFRNTIAKKEVFDFKETYCDENDTISKLLKHNLNQYLKSTILDVGAGIGDISFKALKNKKVIMIDVNNISRHDYPCRQEHKRKKCDFLEFSSKEKINTILISHTLQFIDDDLELLNNKIQELSPENIVIVLNSNNDFMGELIIWSEEHFEKPNPEYRIQGFPQGYNLIKSDPFTSKLKCPDYKSLAKQVSYLMLIDLANMEEALIAFLKKHLRKPEFIFNQSIDVYHKI